MAQVGLKDTDWKKKYQELKSKLIKFTDVAFQQGYQAGVLVAQQQALQEQQQQVAMQMQQAQQAQAQTQQQQMDMQAQQTQQMQQTQDQGQNPEELAQAQQQANQNFQPQDPDIVNQYIEEIESLVNKSDSVPDDLKKSIELLSTELKKSKSYSASYKNNMSEKDKKALSLQEQIVEDVLKSFDNQSQNTASAIDKILKG